MTIETAQDLETIRSVTLYGVEGDINSFPQNLPFSQLYPLCCKYIQNFVSEYYMFSSEYMHSQHDVDEILRKVYACRNEAYIPPRRWTTFLLQMSINLFHYG